MTGLHITWKHFLFLSVIYLPCSFFERFIDIVRSLVMEVAKNIEILYYANLLVVIMCHFMLAPWVPNVTC